MFTTFSVWSCQAAVALMVFNSLWLGAAPADEAAVTAEYKQLERAVREGDGGAWLRLLDSATLAAMPEDAKQNWRSGRFRDASIRYEALGVRVEGDEAAIVGKITSSKGGAHVQHHALMFVREADGWKLASEQYNEHPIDPAALYALVPDRGGAFALARTPWAAVTSVPIGARSSVGAKASWTLQTIRDEAFVFVRCDGSKTLPAPGTEILKAANSPVAETGVPSVPALKVKVVGTLRGALSEYDVHLGAVVQTRATRDPNSGSYHNRYFVQYSLSVNSVRPGGAVDLFDNRTGDRFSRLISIDGSAITVRLPLRALSPAAPALVTLEDATRPETFSPVRINVFAK